MNEEDMKRVTKEAIKEWLDEQVRQVGVWSMKSLVAIILAALMYFVLLMNGWQKVVPPKL